MPIVQFDHENYRLGGAANVAHNVVALGGRVEVVGVVGRRCRGLATARDLAGAVHRHGGLITDRERCTTRKLRVVTTRNQQVARIDYESDRRSGRRTRDRRRQTSPASWPRAADAILVSDYLKGVVHARVAAAAIEAARKHGVPLLVDPKVPHIECYAGATVITPNHHEAESVTHMRIRRPRKRARLRGASGRGRPATACSSRAASTECGCSAPMGTLELPAEAREVSDVTGAGDTVIAAMTLALAAGVSLIDAARLANRAAGIVVGKFGPATVTVEELSSRAGL